MMEIKYFDDHIELAEKPKKLKKLTATRFASVLGLNKWSTPFQMWCEITHAWNKPFEDTKYTLAGKAIEPIVIQYLKERYFLKIHSPAEEFGEDYFTKTRGDFYPEQRILGGMWDARSDDLIVEIKTTSRAEDWIKGIPEHYRLQSALYAWLSGIDKVYVVCSFLELKDYDHPERFCPSAKNTIVEAYSMKQTFPNFERDFVDPVLKWWKDHIETGVSPAFDPKADAEYLAGLKTKHLVVDDQNIKKILLAIESDQKESDRLKAEAKDLEDRLKKHKDAVKKYMLKMIGENDEKCVVSGQNYDVILSKTNKQDIDKKAMENDGVLSKYMKNKVEYRLNVTMRKEEQK